MQDANPSHPITCYIKKSFQMAKSFLCDSVLVLLRLFWFKEANTIDFKDGIGELSSMNYI